MGIGDDMKHKAEELKGKAKEGAGEQRRRADGDRQQTGQAQAWVALEEHLADAAQEDSGCIEERLQGHGGQRGKGRSAGTEMPGLREGRGRSL